jgi:hypothetical protein
MVHFLNKQINDFLITDEVYKFSQCMFDFLAVIFSIAPYKKQQIDAYN